MKNMEPDFRRTSRRKNRIILGLSLFFIISAMISCTKTGSDPKNEDIVYHPLNKEVVLIRDVSVLQQSDDAISKHIDSILNGWINVEFISTGQKDFDLVGDARSDIGFEIIDLNKYNPNGLPESFDSLAARVIPLSIEILDNSTYGYPDALNASDPISGNGYWGSGTGVLGTFLDAGQFKGKGDRYLAIRFMQDNEYTYGWIRIYCSAHNDTLRIIDYAYNNAANSSIYAGQKE
ncbi:MAG: hypothetical protein WCR01_12490 [Bacteroidota bacterium]